MTNKYECKICKELFDKGLKNRKRFTGTRKDVRKHLREKHNIKGKSGEGSGHKGFSIKSELTENTIVGDFK